MIDKIIIAFDYEGEEVEEIKRCLYTLYGTIQGTCPLDRNFGLNLDCLDQPLNIAQNDIALEIIEKTEEYEPRVEVLEANFEYNTDGLLLLSVLIGKGEEEDE